MTCALAFGSATAGTITSDTFSLAQGYVYVGAGTGGVWNTSETSSVNASPGANFTLSVPITMGFYNNATGFFSTNGPTFVNGTLGVSGVQDGISKAGDYNAGFKVGQGSFTATLNAAYTGPTPGDAAALPNYKIQINITNISIYAAGAQAQGTTGTLAWDETTALNPQSQTPQGVTVNPDPNWTYLANYHNIGWTPTGFQSTGVAQDRTFGLFTGAGDSGGTDKALDGFLVTGNIVVTYDTVPEPTTVGLVLLGLTLAGFPRLRRRIRSHNI